EGSSQPREKKRRLRRVVTSDDEAEPQEPSKPAEAPEPVPREGAAPASAAPPTGEALEGPLEGEDLSEIIEKAKKKLETSPAPQEVSRLLTHLESQSMNAQLLVTTKIGLAVSHCSRGDRGVRGETGGRSPGRAMPSIPTWSSRL
ncbi:unnamed protein product, partial [Durusdinium trenchii]